MNQKNSMETDSEFEALKKEFIDSLPGRRENLMHLALKLPCPSSEYSGLYKEIQIIIHRVAGVAAPFGFAHLSQVCCDMDDWLDEASQNQSALKARLEKVIQLFS